MDAKSLRNFKGILIRDYNQMLRDCREAQDMLDRLLNRTIRMEQFQKTVGVDAGAYKGWGCRAAAAYHHDTIL